MKIEAHAKLRLANEYDAAQERGEVATQSRGGANIADGVPGGNTVVTVSDLGLTRKAVHEARRLRDAEASDPGVIRRTLDVRQMQCRVIHRPFLTIGCSTRPWI